MNIFRSRRPRAQSSGAWLALPAFFWLVVFFIIPLLIVFSVSLHTRGPRGVIQEPLTTENYTEVTGETFRPIFERSIEIALVTTLICLVMGYPLAFFIATRRRNSVRQIALFLVVLPFWTNFLVRMYAWRVLLAAEGIINVTALRYGLIDRPLELVLTRDAVLLGMVYGYVPYMVLPIYVTMVRFNTQILQAAYDLGANDWQVFRRVLLPLTMPGVIAGFILVFIPSLGTYVISDMLGGLKFRMIGNLIERDFNRMRWPRGAASAMVLMALVMVGLLLYFLLVERRTYGKIRRQRPDGARRLPTQLNAPVLALSMALAHRAQAALDFVANQRLRLWLNPTWRLRRDMALRRVGALALNIATPLVNYVFLWLPIVVLVVFSFNDSRSLATWHGFTFNWYDRIISNSVEGDFNVDLMLSKLENSIRIALFATIIATIIGTMVALSLVRGRYRFKLLILGLLYLPVGIPEIAQGLSLGIFFNQFKDYVNQDIAPALGMQTDLRLGFWTMIIAHVTFMISYVAIVVQARLTGMQESLEEAARDLGANHWRTFWRVTFPLALPGIIAGALLAFTLSLDDYVVSFFTKGVGTDTLPIYVYSMLKQKVTPDINALSTLMIGVSTVLIALSLILQARKRTET